jgi:hypothetical protein
MSQLTRLELPVHMGDFESLQLLRDCLPASLQELQLGADAGVEEDEGAIAFGVMEAEDVSSAACMVVLCFGAEQCAVCSS